MKTKIHKLVILVASVGLMFGTSALWAETFLTAEQAKQLIFPDKQMQPFEVQLTKEQMQSIKKASKTRVRDTLIKGFKSADGDYLFIDQVVGKHEFIDIAVGLNNQGKVQGIEVLTYRESYGSEIRNPKWQAQFDQVGPEKVLLLDQDIKNISGATLSCRHITDGINRLTQTWKLVLQNTK